MYKLIDIRKDVQQDIDVNQSKEMAICMYVSVRWLLWVITKWGGDE